MNHTKDIIIIDGGTTNTRVHLILDGKISQTKKMSTGASHNSGGQLQSFIKETVQSFLFDSNATQKVSGIFASGMLTSASGLVFVPHLSNDVPLKKLAHSIQPTVLADISDVLFYFVPGYKIVAQSAAECDVIKGEETEIYGYLSSNAPLSSATFLHFGSHAKCICVDDFCISRSVTTASGELLSAICENTILRQSLNDFQKDAVCVQDLDFAIMIEGFDIAKACGFSRAVFAGRLQDLILKKTAVQVFSYLLGVLAQSDFEAFYPLLGGDRKTVLYGRPQFSAAFTHCCAHNGVDTSKFVQLSYEDSESLSVAGLLQIAKDFFS